MDLAPKLAGSTFLLNLGLMFDALEELGKLSEALQAETINLYKAHRLIVRQIVVFVSRKSEEGERYSEAYTAVSDVLFCGVTNIVKKTAKIVKLINRGHF